MNFGALEKSMHFLAKSTVNNTELIQLHFTFIKSLFVKLIVFLGANNCILKISFSYFTDNGVIERFYIINLCVI